MIRPFRNGEYAAIRARFSWPEPLYFNMGDAICGRWARETPSRTALIVLTEDGRRVDWSFRALDRAANRIANALAGLGLKRGDRCGVVLGQGAEAAATYVALYKMGAIAAPMASVIGAEGLAIRLADAGARALIADRATFEKLEAAKRLPSSVDIRLSADGPAPGVRRLVDVMGAARDHFRSAPTRPDDPAFLCYTSGTTGAPKGALHGHRTLIGHLPVVQMWSEGLPRPGDVAWTPSDWAWLGGLCNIMTPALSYGAPMVAARMAKFDPDAARAVMARLGVTLCFMPPTALRLMRAEDPNGAETRRRVGRLRAVGCAGEPLGAELLRWGREAFGLGINEFYGQTECNGVIGNSGALFPARPGSMGRPTPGFEIAMLDEDGAPQPVGAAGEIAIRRGARSMMLEYWRNPSATARAFTKDGRWLRTGDEGVVGEDGHVAFIGRRDDVISSAGYRIGPSEVEDCLTGHSAVAMAGVVGAPDAVRGEIVKAFVVLRPEASAACASPELARQLQNHVRTRLGGHVYPRVIEFVDALPITTTGKIRRAELRAREMRQRPAS